ncbi:MAG: S1C family serine protease [Allosphingosinicella sp.]|uniref:S1C family serine protease n=1 Tax=Allosphingosinicella sp. TaxID=2823234 RepID=UPI003942FB16
MIRFLVLLLALLAAPAAAQTDDIGAASRSVVRVVVIASEDDQIVGLGHGTGFAISRNRIVTNAHVVTGAREYSENISIGIVPSEGSQSFPARLVTLDPARDLALIELEQGALPPIPLYMGPLPDGAQVVALGYPGNVDMATAGGAEDFISPIPPTRSIGNFSNERRIQGTAVLLHTASIARGHSGGPLLDPCGRVLGVNTFITRAEEGDASFFFAITNRELAIFLRDARQPFQTVASECVSMAERLSQEQERALEEARAREAERMAREQAEREALDRARADIDETRENRLALAVLLIVLALVAAGGAGILLLRNRNRPAALLGGAALLLLLGSVAAFLSRPDRDEALAAAREQGEEAARPAGAPLAARNLCRILPDRSRITVSSTEDVELGWTENGCVNGRTQYAPDGGRWSRILVPNDEQAVAVLEVDPARREYVVSRYQLDARAMARARELRGRVTLSGCPADPALHEELRWAQREIADVLPRLPNERLVYRCDPIAE